MIVRLAKKEWIHPALVTPKSPNFAISLNDASKKYAERNKKESD